MNAAKNGGDRFPRGLSRLGFSQSGPPGVQVDGEEDGPVKCEGGDQAGEGNRHVVLLKHVGHDESRNAHHGRHELPPG